jgi:DNA replication and repair protein RecF
VSERLRVERLWLTQFRSYEMLEVEPAPGLTAFLGANGQGKTNVLEAVGWLATMRSFRGVTDDALVRAGASSATVRADIGTGTRRTRIEAEIAAAGRNRVLVNGQRLNRARDLLGHVRVTVFAPDDLDIVKGAPAGRRDVLDDALVALSTRYDRTRRDYDRVLRHRNALLKQAGGRITAEVTATLDVWDTKLAAAGEQIGAARAALADEIGPALEATYRSLAPQPAVITTAYDAPWRATGLAMALTARRSDELRRGVTLAGPHRDDLVLCIDGLPARTHRSQGEQRSLALALRLALHRHIEATTGIAPVLLLDDVFSELDEGRSAALVDALPNGQTLLTSAVGLPPGAHPELIVDVAAGRATPRG